MGQNFSEILIYKSKNVYQIKLHYKLWFEENITKPLITNYYSPDICKYSYFITNLNSEYYISKYKADLYMIH